MDGDVGRPVAPVRIKVIHHGVHLLPKDPRAAPLDAQPTTNLR